MVYIEAPGTEAEYNLALEEYIFNCLPKDEAYFMLWQNDNAVIVGKNQNTEAEINQEYVEKQQIHVVRRLSGGGAVYHDLGNLNFTFITDIQEAEQLDLHMFCEAMAMALRELGISAEVNGRNDITVDGKKVSGNAQYIKNKRIMHHGTILYDSDLECISHVLKVTGDKLEGKGTKSVRTRVTNVREHLEKDMTLEEFKEHLLGYVFEGRKAKPYHFSEKQIKEIERIRDERYNLWTWNYGKSPSCTVRREKRIEGCGKIEAYIKLDGGSILQIEFRGDYFGIRDLGELSEALAGCRLWEQELNCALSGYNLECYFHGCSRGDLISLILGKSGR